MKTIFSTLGLLLFISSTLTAQLFTAIPVTVQQLNNSSAAWGDYDNDGKPDVMINGGYTDLVFTGLDGFGVPTTHIYSNNLGFGVFATNTAPEMPEGLSASTSGNSVTLNWERAIDAQTPSKGLSYNLYLGTSSALPDVVSPNSGLTSGIRHLALLGNTSQDTNWTISDLEDGDYFWSVQTIDNGFMGSLFSPEQTFNINAVGIRGTELTKEFSIYPNPVKDRLFVSSSQTERFDIRIYSVAGKMVLSTSIQGSPSVIDISDLSAGVYMVRFITTYQTQVIRFIKK